MTETLNPIPKPNGIGHIKTTDERSIVPIERLRYMSADQYEDFILEWAHGYLMKGKDTYREVVRSGGSGDKGRDIVAYKHNNNWDCYQCKYYDAALTPTDIWKELGKLCYYTFNNSYSIPDNYFLLAPDGIGTKLQGYIDNPVKFRAELIDNWDNYCATEITSISKIELVGDLRSHVDSFDFGIVKGITPLTLLDQHQKTIWFPFRFGGIAPMRKEETMPPSIQTSEIRYIQQLLEVYSEHLGKDIKNIEDLDNNKELKKHLDRQRVCYFSAETLQQLSRDISNDAVRSFEEIKDDILSGVIEICEEKHASGYERVKKTIQAASTIAIERGTVLKTHMKVDDKKGLCHHLANENKLIWVREDD